MVRRVKNELGEEEVHGVLNDFDLAIELQETPDAANERRHITGTQLFMAVDMLGDSPPSVHCGRHDMESLFWVVIWFIFRYVDGKEYTPDEPGQKRELDDWLTTLDLESKKKSFLMDGAGRSPRTPWMDAWDDWIVPLLMRYQQARTESAALQRELRRLEAQPKTHNPRFEKMAKAFDSRWDELKFNNDVKAWQTFMHVLTGNLPCEFTLDERFVDYDQYLTIPRRPLSPSIPP